MKNEEYKEYLKINKDPNMKMLGKMFLMLCVALLFLSFFEHGVIYCLIYLIIFSVIMIVIYKIDSINWEVTKGKFIIINKNEFDVTLIDMERKDEKPRKQPNSKIFNVVRKDDVIEAIYKYRIFFGGKKIYKILEILKVNDEDK